MRIKNGAADSRTRTIDAARSPEQTVGREKCPGRAYHKTARGIGIRDRAGCGEAAGVLLEREEAEGGGEADDFALVWWNLLGKLRLFFLFFLFDN